MPHREFYAGLDFDLTKVTASGGHSNAVGLRLYDDAVSRPSRFGSGDFLRNTSPAASDATYKDPTSVNWTTYKEIGTWSFVVE